MKNIILIFYTVSLLLLAGCVKKYPVPDSRSFHMGFTNTFAYDTRPYSQEETYEFFNNNADIVSIHVDLGVPWEEALNNTTYPARVEETIDFWKSHISRGSKIFLSLEPLNGDRNGIAEYWGDPASDDIMAKWQAMTFTDSLVIKAYLNYCRRMISKLNPDYLAYGIEVNQSFDENDTTFKQFLIFCDTIYSTLKAEYPSLPVMLTLVNGGLDKSFEDLYKVTSSFVAYTDYIAVSTYPYLMDIAFYEDADPENIPDNWLQRMRDMAPGKPFVVSETGFPSEDVKIGIIEHRANEKWQMEYMNLLFNACQELNAEFVIWFFHRDTDQITKFYDAWGMVEPQLFAYKAWQNIGLYDVNNKEKLSRKVWANWYEKPKK